MADQPKKFTIAAYWDRTRNSEHTAMLHVYYDQDRIDQSKLREFIKSLGWGTAMNGGLGLVFAYVGPLYDPMTAMVYLNNLTDKFLTEKCGK